MSISEALLESHISKWEAKLSPGYRSRWPSRLFRHEALENAVELLKSFVLLSRQDASGILKRDIAPEEIINLNSAAHGYARLYFRPRTPTQYRIEGIRRTDEIWNARHAPVLFMFVIRSKDVLTKEGVRFSKGNMQIPGTEMLSGDAAFSELDFRKIYHEGSYTSDEADIKVWRCAEILCPSPLMLSECLEAVVCRSDAERRTLLHFLGSDAAMFGKYLKVVTQPGYFNAEYAFVESVDINAKAVRVKFHARRKMPMSTWVKLDVVALDDLAGSLSFVRQELDLRTEWDFSISPQAGRYKVTILIDDELAYQSVLRYDEDPF